MEKIIDFEPVRFDAHAILDAIEAMSSICQGRESSDLNYRVMHVI